MAPSSRTRGRMKRESLATLPLDNNLLVHVFGALKLHHGQDELDAAAAVCRCWHDRVAGRAHVHSDIDNYIGELRSGDKPHRFDRPHDMIFLPQGHIMVADCDNFRLQVVSQEGYYIREVKLNSPDGGTSCPTGLATAGEALYVVEHGAHQVSKLRRSSSSGNRHAQVGSWGGGDGELRHPWGVTVGGGKRVYVTDCGNDRICAFDADKLRFLFSFGQRGGKLGEFRGPRGLVAHGNELFVVDQMNHRVQVLDLAPASDGTLAPLRAIGGGPSATVGRFNLPSGIAIANERLYVTEMGGERLQVLSMEGLPLQCLSGVGPLSGVCADDEYVCASSLDGDHALTLWRVAPTKILGGTPQTHGVGVPALLTGANSSPI